MMVTLKPLRGNKSPVQFHNVTDFYIKRGCYIFTLKSGKVIVASMNTVRCWCEKFA